MVNPESIKPERAGDIKRVETVFGPLTDEQRADFLKKVEEMEQEDYFLRDQRCGGCDVAGPPPWRRRKRR